MRAIRFFGLVVALGLVASVANGEDVKSGPDKKIGGAFNVKAVTGEKAGKTLCYVCKFGGEQRPGVGVLRGREHLLDRPLLDDLQLEQAGRPDDLFRSVHVAHTRQLDQDLVTVGPLLGDARLGHTQFVDATLDRLARLHHGFAAQGRLDVRLQGEGVGPVRAGAPVEVDERVRRGGRVEGPAFCSADGTRRRGRRRSAR